MQHTTSHLRDMMDLQSWQTLQDALAHSTNMAIITVDYKGQPVTAHSRCSSFCSLVRQDPKLTSYCHKCDARGGLEAVCANSAHTYYCHFGIIDIAIPVVIDDVYLGAIMAGQVRLKATDHGRYFEHIYSPKNRTFIQDMLDTHQAEYEALPVLTMEQIDNHTKMLSQLAHYIVGEAIDKKRKVDTFASLTREGATTRILGTSQAKDPGSLKKIQEEVANALLDSLIKDSDHDQYLNVQKAIKLALEQIHSNKGAWYSLEEMAAITYLSPSYFSRLFKKEVGVNFNTYLSDIKMLWAKELLHETDMTINQVSDTLGFSDTGYFVKKFKKAHGITPGRYRGRF